MKMSLRRHVHARFGKPAERQRLKAWESEVRALPQRAHV
jgi:hypothetical protein